MARTREEIQAQIWGNVTGDAVLEALLTSDSLTAIWWLWTWVVANAVWTHESLWDAFEAKIKALLAAMKPHTLSWYAAKAKAFQYGDDLPDDSDVYDPVAPAGASSLIVSVAASVELNNEVRIKVAKGVPGALEPLGVAELSAFAAYMQRLKDAGVRINCTSNDPDTFQPQMVIHYDALVIGADGARLDGTAATPVKDAINSFLANINFNGRFILDDFITAMMAVDGVTVAEVVVVLVGYAGVAPTAVTNWRTPDAGYLALDEAYYDANVTFVPYS